MNVKECNKGQKRETMVNTNENISTGKGKRENENFIMVHNFYLSIQRNSK